MKKYLSVFEMITRCSIYKVVLILIAMTVAEIILFISTMEAWTINDGYYAMEVIVSNSKMLWVLGIAMLLIVFCLVRTGCNIGSVQSYTLLRLRIQESKILLLQVIYNAFCLVLLWGTQLMIFLVCYSIYEQKATDITNQTLYLAFYRNDFMHSILPLEDWIGWLFLIYIILTCSISAAGFSFQQRRGKIAWELFLIIALTMLTFPRALGQDVTLMILTVIVFPVVWMYRITAKEEHAYERK